MYSVIDIGSNTVRLVAYQVKDNQLVAMINKKYSVGLAGYILNNNNNNDSSQDFNYLSDEGIQKLINILLEFQSLLEYINLKEVFPFATASLRNIKNSAQVLDTIREKTNFDIQLLSGEEEALFDYAGMKQSLNTGTGIMVDIGGGSTELVFFKENKTLLVYSLPIGSLNMYNNFVNDIIPTEDEIIKIQEEVKKHLELLNITNNFNNFNKIDNSIKLSDFNTICAVGGTARAVSKIVNRKKKQKYKQEPYSSKELSKLVEKASANSNNNTDNNISESSINVTNTTNLNNSCKKLTDNILKICADRVHTIIPGFIILDAISNEYRVETIVTSQYGVREGYLHSKLGQRGVLND